MLYHSDYQETAWADVQDSDDTDHSSAASQKTKKVKVVTDLTKEEEESMVEWLESYPILYNKKLQAYKDTAKKERLWMEKANKMGKSVLILKTWYTSLRSRFGRLKKKRSGDDSTESEMTERDLWIIKRFEFLCPHIHEVQKKTMVTRKKKLAASSSITTTPVIIKEEDDNNTIRPQPAHSSLSMDRSRQNPIFNEAEEALLAELEARSQQMIALQQQVIDKLRPSADREREAFVDWMRSVILDLDHGLWRRCQYDISQILYRYIGENDQLKSHLIQQHPHQQHS